MRHPVLTTFAMMSFIGASCFAVACAKDGPEIEPIVGYQPATPEDGGETKSVVVEKEKPKPKPKKDAAAEEPVDAGPPDTGAPPGDDDDDDDDDDNVTQADCPQDMSYMSKWMLASQMGGVTCTSGGDECAVNECCFVYPVPGLGDSYCVAE